MLVLVHGGAGRVTPESLPEHVAGCGEAATAGLEKLRETGSALDAAQAAVAYLETAPLYNAGTGGSLTADGTLEFDAAVMRGDLAAGAVSGLPPFEHPIDIARMLLDEGGRAGAPVMMGGPGAARWAEARGFVPAGDEMITDRARERLAAWRAGQVGEGWAGGTVGAVAWDGAGSVAAATSTGGTVGKPPGRIGDSPILGAGTWADDRTGACSATGIGEAILRLGLARGVCDRARALGDAQAAADAMLVEFTDRVGGSGGFILVTPDGQVGIARNTATMSHAVARDGAAVVTGH